MSAQQPEDPDATFALTLRGILVMSLGEENGSLLYDAILNYGRRIIASCEDADPGDAACIILEDGGLFSVVGIDDEGREVFH